MELGFVGHVAVILLIVVVSFWGGKIFGSSVVKRAENEAAKLRN